MNDYNFGNFLCTLRERKGLTQADIARELGVTPAAVSKWENGSSKPRVEILFRLANILDVRSEELMAGHYIVAETVNPENIEEINERYEYLRKVNSYNRAGVKFRRLLAWIIDWNIVGSIALTVAALLAEFLLPTYSQLGILCIFLAMLSYPVCFILRDFIFRGRSLGKRITRLVVLHKRTGLPASLGKCILRNLFLPAMQMDAIFLLASGATIGDRCAQTVVVSKKVLEENPDDPVDDIERINSYSKPKLTSTKKVLGIVLGSIAAFFVFVLSVTLLALSAQKDTEQYKTAYKYFVESETFQDLQVDESKIWMNQYSSYSSSSSGTVSRTVRIGFVVRLKAFQVTCHEENGVWQICEECTTFD